MHKIGRIGIWLFLILLISLQLTSQAQGKKYFIITGKIVPEAAEAGSGVIEITKNSKETSRIDIPKNGRFRFELEFFNVYSLKFLYPGHFDKIIIVSTEIPQEVWERDSDFPPFPMVVQLQKEFEGIDKSFSLKPSGRIFYEKAIDNFAKESYISDIQFVEQIENAKSQANQVQKESDAISKDNAAELANKQKNFDEVIKEADAHYQRGEYQLALMKYLEARKLFPDKAYPNDRVAELQDLVKALEITEKQKAELEQKYKAAITRANGFFEQKSYREARPDYEEALTYKPGDVFANGRINEIDQLLALLDKQKQYKDLIAQADKSYKSKNYDQAITTYNQAILIIPEDQYPKDQITLINQEKEQQSKLEQTEKEYNQTIQSASALAQQKDYLNALASYKKALSIKPDSKLAQDKIAEMELAIVGLETDKKYQQAIQLADQSLASKDFQKAKMQYQEALKIKSNETYPTSKLAEIAKTEADEINFNGLTAKAEKAFADNNFDEALNLYSQALELKPKNAIILKRVDEIQNLKRQQVSKKEYDDLIVQADKAFQDNQFDASIAAYNKALSINKNETYPKDQIKKIESYQSLIKKADKSFNSQDYTGSLDAYNQALNQKPNDVIVTGRIAEINGILGEKKKQEDQAKAELASYNELLKTADQLFTATNYTESLNKYKEAANLRTSESYPKKRIKEIENILDGLAKDKIRKDKEYQDVLAQADKLLERKDYLNAQAGYRKALEIKPEDAYPKDQIQKIDGLLAENLKREQENQRLQNEKTEQAYLQAMTAADKSFTSSDFEAARTGYQTALTIKPNDVKAKEKLGQTEAKIAEIARMTQAYNKAITEANGQLTNKKYQEAKEKYQEALQYLPDSDYPKRQIAKIDELLAQKEAELKARQDFDQALAEGEALLKKKELNPAKDAFMKAYNLIPSEPVPPKKIAEINALLADQATREASLKATMEAYQNAIQRADKNFNNKEYSSAKLVYNEALLIKPDEKYPVDQLALIDKLLAEQTEQLYKTAISKGDNAFNTNQFDNAITSYTEAITYKKNDQYATKKLKEIDQKKADLLAEQNRLKSLEDQYKTLVADAGNDFKNKDYPKSKEKYQKALGLKPNETFPKEQIAKIDELLAAQQKEAEKNSQYDQFMVAAQKLFDQKKLKEARDTYQKAYNLKPFEALPPMRISQIDEMLAALDEAAQKAARDEAERLAKEKADRLQYENAIAAGDKSFGEKQYMIARNHYTTALTALPDEKYPKDQIAKIDDLLSRADREKALALEKAKQDSLQKVKDKQFESIMTEARNNDQNKRYQQAIQKYQEASKINPSQAGSIRKLIKDIEDKIQLLAKQDQEYQRIIKLADGFYGNSKLNEALTEYRNASSLKAEEEYPKKQIQEILSQLAAIEEKYNKAITNGDQAFNSSDWQNAKLGYTEALVIKPKETYPANRLKEVNQKIADSNQAALANSNLEKAYKEALDSGEKAMKEKQLSTAKMQFQIASSLKPNEKLPIDRIKEIDLLIDQRNKERLAQVQRELDEKYRQAISVADNSFKQKSYTIAKLQYQQASLIKTEETYPKTQMALIDKLLSEAKPVDTYAFELPKVETSQSVPKQIYNPTESEQATETRAQSFTTITNYDEAVKRADDSFGIKDYSVARFFYLKASDIKPAEEYPKKQLELIRKLIDSQLSNSDISGYDMAISQADAAFDKKNYTIAKFYYYKALEIKSWEKYPKDRINEILALTNSLLSEKEEKEYKDIIAKADEAYVNKDIAIARFYYNKALSMKKDEDYPRIKLKEIQKLIEQDKLEQQKLEYEKIIGEADQAMKDENYSMARFNYNKALTMKPNEKYPKDQLKLLKKTLSKPNK
jgi:tetratricopeptide (TPR) repeat protein